MLQSGVSCASSTTEKLSIRTRTRLCHAELLEDDDSCQNALQSQEPTHPGQDALRRPATKTERETTPEVTATTAAVTKLSSSKASRDGGSLQRHHFGTSCPEIATLP